MIDVFDLAKRKTRGVRLLDRRLPKWREILRRHRDDFNFNERDYCVIGTLRHYTPEMKKLREKAGSEAFCAAVGFLTRTSQAVVENGPISYDYGFDLPDAYENRGECMSALSQLWRAEFETEEK